MSCSKQHSPAVYLKFIKQTTGVDITQSEWHEIKQLAKAAGYDVSKTRADGADAKRVLSKLAKPYKDTLLKGQDLENALEQADLALLNHNGEPYSVVTRGTIGNIDFLTDNYLPNVINGIRSRNEIEKKRNKSAKGSTLEAYWDAELQHLEAARKEQHAMNHALQTGGDTTAIALDKTTDEAYKLVQATSQAVKNEVARVFVDSRTTALQPISRAAFARAIPVSTECEVETLYSDYRGARHHVAKEARVAKRVNGDEVIWARDDGSQITMSITREGTSIFTDTTGKLVIEYDNGTRVVIRKV
jgi:hypothetical protein